MSIVQPQPLRTFAASILTRAGTDEVIAQAVSAKLVEANLTGHDSHGVGMLERYVQTIKSGGLDPNAEAVLVHRMGNMMIYEGNRGFGQITGDAACEALARSASQNGVAALGLRNTHHLGRIGAYAEQLADRGLVSIMFVNVRSSSSVAPWGSKVGRLGTNPVCIGVPREGQSHFILDFATSIVALGKVQLAYRNGIDLKHEAVVDNAGAITRSPDPMFANPRGALLPFGEHKGSGLAIACSILAGALIGGKTEQSPPEVPGSIINGLLAIAIDPRAAGTSDSLKQEVEEYVAWIKASERREPGTPVLVPGEPEAEVRSRRSKEGIDLDRGTLESLGRAAELVGAAPNSIDELLVD